MGLLYETSTLGISVRVFSDRVEYKIGFFGAVQIIPIAQIASIKLGTFLLNRIVLETTGGREYAITTNKKKEVTEAIYQAQAGLRSVPAPAPQGSVADELTKLARLREQGILSHTEFERQKAMMLGTSSRSITAPLSNPTRRTAPSAPSNRGAPSLGRKIKLVALTILGLLAAMIVIGAIVGPKHKDPNSASTNAAAEQPAITFRDYRVEVTNHPKERASDQEFRQCDVIFTRLPDRSDVVDTIVRTALQAEIKKDDRTDILAMAFLGDEAIGDPQWSGPLIYKASAKRILTVDEDQGIATHRVDMGRYFLEISDGKTAEGITPEKKWLSVSFVFPSRPPDAEIYKVVTDELSKHRGIKVSGYVYIGDKANGMSWQQIDDKDEKYIHCTVNPSGQIIEGSILFTSRAKAAHR